MDAGKQFFSASDRRVLETSWQDLDENTRASAELNDAVRQLANLIDERVPHGRNKSIALTSLEDVQMRSNRGIFASDGFR